MSIKNQLTNNVYKNKNYLDNVFSSFFNEIRDLTNFDYSLSSNSLSFRVNLSENDSEYFLTAELPGINQNEVDLKINNNTLSIEGKKTLFSESDPSENFHVKEIKSGVFSRSFSFPNTIDAEKITAKFDQGLLTVKIPKKSESKAKKIMIES